MGVGLESGGIQTATEMGKEVERKDVGKPGRAGAGRDLVVDGRTSHLSQCSKKPPERSLQLSEGGLSHTGSKREPVEEFTLVHTPAHLLAHSRAPCACRSYTPQTASPQKAGVLAQL